MKIFYSHESYAIFTDNNQIKSINGRTFDQSPLLRVVNLKQNVCIDDELEGGQTIKDFSREVIRKCAFTETGEREFEKVFDIECGVGQGGSGFVVGGNETKRGQWPFMAALLLESTNQFFCGGSVITTSHVLTAAHCIHEKHFEDPLEPSELVVVLGRHNISRRLELGSEIRGIREIKVHPRWNPGEPKFEADVTVLTLDRAVQFSELIQPVCLTIEPEISEREAGYVVCGSIELQFSKFYNRSSSTGRLGKKRRIRDARDCSTASPDFFRDNRRLFR